MKQLEKTRITRDRIISAAMDEFGKSGYSGASLNNICEHGIPKGLIYHNFKGKDDLYLSCVEICFNGLTEYINKAEVGNDLQKYISARLCYFRENENEAHIFFDAVLQPPRALVGKIDELREDLDSLNKEIYGQILSSVTLREGISYDDALWYFSVQQTMFNGYFSSPAFCNIPFSEKISIHESRLASMLDFMLYGIAERKL